MQVGSFHELSTLNHIFKFISVWLAPILCFTMEEVWQSRYGEKASSIHLEDFPDIDKEWGGYEEIFRWEVIKDVRKVVTGAIEVEEKPKDRFKPRSLTNSIPQ